MEFSGKEIKALRKVLQMSQTEFGASVGVSKLTVINWELGKTEIKKESTKKKIQELMKEHNLANASDLLGGVEIISSDTNNKIITVNIPYEAFEPSIFSSLLDKFLSNPDVSTEEKAHTIRSIRHKLLNYEDNPSDSYNAIHIWPDAYLAKRKNTDCLSNSSSNDIFEGQILFSSKLKQLPELDNKIKNDSVLVEEIFNLTYLPSYISTSKLINNINAHIHTGTNITSLYQLAMVVADKVMSNQNSNAFDMSVRPPELHKFFDNFASQLSVLGMPYVYIKKIFTNCRYCVPSDINKSIRRGIIDPSYNVLFKQLVKQKYLTENDMSYLKSTAEEGCFVSFKNYLFTQDKTAIKAFINGFITVYDIVSLWFDDGFTENQLIEHAKIQGASEKQCVLLELFMVVYKIELFYDIKLENGYNIVLDTYKQLKSNSSDEELINKARTQLHTLFYNLLKDGSKIASPIKIDMVEAT